MGLADAAPGRIARRTVLVGLALLVLAAAPARAGIVTPSANPVQLANVISAQSGLVAGASFPIGPASPSANGVAGPAGQFFPTDGTQAAVLTNGSVANADPPNNSGSAGTNDGTTARGVNDPTTLRIDVNVPSGTNCIGFDFAFYSEEFPESVGSNFNDAFLAEVDGNDWSFNAADNTVTAPHNIAFDTNGRQLTVNTALASQTDTLLQYDGSTVALRARQQVTPGAHQLYFTIFDAGDHTYDSAVFLDNLRAFAATPAQCQPGARPVDSDGDGLPDDWETNGVDRNGDGRADVPLNLYGADPQHKDLFVQLDSMRGHQLPQAALDIPINSFANAPVTNPDGHGGITLHVDNGPTSIMNPRSGARWGSRSRANTNVGHVDILGREVGGAYDWSAFDAIKNASFSASRAVAFRYALSGHRYANAAMGNNSSGLARGGWSDFMVMLGRTCSGATDCTTGSVGAQGSTFMHEMGHTLGLAHGGPDGLNRKPNYLSVMNYNWQFPGLRRVGSTASVYDYSRFGAAPTPTAGSLPALNENALVEGVGVSATGDAANFETLRFCGSAARPPFRMNAGVDWNCNGSVSGTVAASVNNDSARSTLAGQNDWLALRYKAGSIGGFSLSALQPDRTPQEETITTDQLQNIAQVVNGDAKRPKIKIKRRRRAGKIRVVVTATDNKAIDHLDVAIGKKHKTVVAKRSKTVTKLVFKTKVKPGKRILAVAFDRAGNQRGRKLRAR